MIRFDDQVAIITGAAAGLGRAHALGLAARGCKLVINDMNAEAAQNTVDEITAMGAEAMVHTADVSDEAQAADMVAQAVDKWGRIDIVVNNAGILRDKSFAKMDLAEFRKVIDVHLMGSTYVTHAAWPHMRAAQYGRVVFTSSSSGLYGNFGQANYGAAKTAMLGLMNVLHIEGARDNIRVNILAPTAITAMTEGLIPADAAALLQPETITPGLLYLASDNAPSRVILSAGAGSFAQTQIRETEGISLQGDDLSPETIAARFSEIQDSEGAHDMPDAFSQTRRFAQNAAKLRGLKLDW